MSDNEKPQEIVPSADEIMSVFSFDVEEPKSEPEGGAPPAAPPDGAPVEGTPTTPPAPAAAPAPTPAPTPAETPAPLPELGGGAAPPSPEPAAAPPSTDPRDLQLASLTAQVEALQAMLQQQPTPSAPTPTETPEQETARLVKPEEYAYNLSIPPPVLESIFNEDATKASNGLHHLINNLAGIIHRNVLVAARRDLDKFRVDQQSEQGQTQFQQAQAAAQNEYYTTYPQHNDPVIKMIVAQQAQKLGEEYPQLPWGDQFKLALGARVEQALGALRGAQPAAPTAGPTPVAPSAPAPAKPASFMPVAPSVPMPRFENDAEVIASTFSFN